MNNSDIILGIIAGPVWTDRCGHGGYITSYECWFDNKEQQIDLYIFEIYNKRQSVCLRYGENDPDYAWLQKELAKWGPLDPNRNSDMGPWGYGAGVNPGA